jgi:hypothetical protein
MEKNASRIDANVRRIFGILLSGLGIFLWAYGYVLAGLLVLAAGLYLILTGSLRHAPEYRPFRFRTHHEPMGPPER